MKRYRLTPSRDGCCEAPDGEWVLAEEAVASRRERIATAALAQFTEGHYADRAKAAVLLADALIEQLDEPRKEGEA